MKNNSNSTSIFTGGPKTMGPELIGKEIEFTDQESGQIIAIILTYLSEAKPDRWDLIGRIGQSTTFTGRYNSAGKVGSYKIF